VALERFIPMKFLSRFVCYLVMKTIALSLLYLSPLMAEEPTLVRLSFWVPPERMEEFGAAYAEQVAPLLEKHGLVAWPERDRATVDSVFSRLYVFATLDSFFDHRNALWNDPAWESLRERLGEAFGVADRDGFIRCQFVSYQCPAVVERSVPVGGGTRRDGWRTFGVQDGLPYPAVFSILTDRDGQLWFVRDGRITRYDGETFTSFATADTLSHFPDPLLQDREGHLWFTGLEGVTRYDGETFVTFTVADGLAGDKATNLLQDRHGHLWLGSDTGVTRYDGEIFQSFTSRDGLPDDGVYPFLEDRDGMVWFGIGERWRGEIKGIIRYDGETFQTLTAGDGPVGHVVFSMLEDSHGHLWFGGRSKVTRYDGKRSRVFTPQDGLVEDDIRVMLEDRDGHLWFGSGTAGLSRFDGKEYTTFTTKNGLPNNQILGIAKDEEGYLWVGTYGGLSRYEGSHWVTFTESDGLPSSYVLSVLQDGAGTMWFGTVGGLVRYDGEELVTFTAEHGLAGDRARVVVEDLEGNLWIRGIGSPQVTRYDGKSFNVLTISDSLNLGWTANAVVDRNGRVWFSDARSGVVQYDGQGFSRLTTDDGLINNEEGSLIEDRAGNMWFSTSEGVSKYDGETFTHFTRADGLGFTPIAIGEDHKGHMWFGSYEGELVRYDGNGFETLAFGEGPKAGIVGSIISDRRNHLWFGIFGAGIVRYDGLVFQDLHHRDGLVSDTVQRVCQDRDGDFWITTDSGITRYTPSTTPPGIRLKEVIADRSYGSVQELSLPSSQHLIQFIFLGRSFSTPPDRMVYVYRLRGYEEEWQPTRQTEVRYTDLPIGDYVFQVKAVDRDLNYSEPVDVRLEIHLPYGQLGLFGVAGLSLAGLVIASGYGIKRRRERDQAREQWMRGLEEELQTAHDLQMGLMPTESPRIEGFDIAGHCLPANHVGGDFFQYFHQDGKLSPCMADVTGHAMEAAIPVVMFNGILESQMELGGSLEDLFARLNRSLHRTRVDNRTFVCFTMGELDTSTRRLRLSNGGCPYPLHCHAATGQVSELQVDAYPLGVRADTVYLTIEVQLEPGDRIVFYSDGIPEAANAQEEIFGFERTTETIRQACAEDLSAEALTDRLIGTVKAFAGEAPQGDDMTVVVLKVEA